MRRTRLDWVLILCCVSCSAPFHLCGQRIPDAAWSRAIGQPLENAGVRSMEDIVDDGYWQGIPLGGFGAGSITQSYRGDFVRWHLKVGVRKYQSVPSSVFAAFEQAEGSQPEAVVLRSGKPEDPSILSAWNWSYPAGSGTYHALFPKAWFDYEYKPFPVQLTCEQFSPVLPNNYKETSYPLGLFIWHAKNNGQKPVKVSILFSWTNVVGWLAGFGSRLDPTLGGGNFNAPREETLAGGRKMTGIVFDRARPGTVEMDSDGQFAVAALGDAETTVSRQTSFQAFGDGKDLWESFARDGTLQGSPKNWVAGGEDPTGDSVAGAIAVSFTVQPGMTKEVPIVLSWDFPIAQFGGGRRWYRRYTEFFGTGGNSAWRIARTGLEHYEEYSKAINDWQRPFIEDTSKPAWYRGMLFNELYDLVDGGTLWTNGEAGKRTASPPHYFAYLENFDYQYYCPLDVFFYGSWGLLRSWPELEKQVMRQSADTVPVQYTQYRRIVSEGTIQLRKVAGDVALDFGAPKGDPIRTVNQYAAVNPTLFKDKPSQFVLMVYRDYVWTGSQDLAFLQHCWPGVKAALDHLKEFDTKGDGLPQNQNMPDQTYDAWRMKGTSAYCGSLWLAALKAAVKIAERLDDAVDARKYQAWFDKAQASFIRELWNGEYFNFDLESPYRNTIMADQLAGQWYANLCGLGEIVPKEMTHKALETIFRMNVMKLENGEMGAVNGMNLDGTVLKDNLESKEVWSGTTLALASFLKSEGMTDEAYKAAWGVYNIVYRKKGYWFRTPEAWDETGNFRAELYMRPQVIWAMESMQPPGNGGTKNSGRARRETGLRPQPR
jgi:non-lysosomal glucosylceramidase